MTPPAAPQARRTHRFEYRANDAEAAALDRVAAAYGGNRGAAARAGVAALDAAADERRAAVAAGPPPPDYVRLRKEVHRIGQNVNQAVYRLHRAGVTNDADALADLYDGLLAALEVLGE